MKKMTLVLALFGLVLGMSSAQAGTKFSVMGDINLSTPKDSSGTNTWSAKMGFGGGAGLELGLSSSVGLAIEAIYEMRKAEVSGASVKTTQILFPVAARIWASPMFNFLVGGYYSMGMGDVTLEQSGVSVTQTYSQIGAKSSDYGAVGGIGLNFGSGGGHFFFDARYYLGLADINDPAVAGSTTKISTIQGLLGYRFGGK